MKYARIILLVVFVTSFIVLSTPKAEASFWGWLLQQIRCADTLTGLPPPPDCGP